MIVVGEDYMADMLTPLDKPLDTLEDLTASEL